MTIASQIVADADIFFDSDENPFVFDATYTPPGGGSTSSVSVIFNIIPIHGDENQDNPVTESEITAIAKSSDVSAFRLRGTLTVNGVDFQLINNPYPSSAHNHLSVLELRYPTREYLKI